jgi:tetratricopeptide (TPR) repeat protein
VLKIEEIGDQEIIDQLNNSERDKLADIRASIEEVFVRASDHFCRGKYGSALKGYCRILQAANYSVTNTKEEEKSRTDILNRVQLNIAVVHNKTGEHKEALNQISGIEAIGSIENNPKVLYHKGLALMKLGELDEAVGPITKAIKLKPLDNQIIAAVEELERRKKAYEENKKAFAKKLGFQ